MPIQIDELTSTVDTPRPHGGVRIDEVSTSVLPEHHRRGRAGRGHVSIDELTTEVAPEHAPPHAPVEVAPGVTIEDAPAAEVAGDAAGRAAEAVRALAHFAD